MDLSLWSRSKKSTQNHKYKREGKTIPLLICLLGIISGFGIVPSAARGATVLVRGPRWPPAPVVAFAATTVASAAAAVLPLVELSVGKFSATWLIFSPLYKYRDIIYVCIYEYILSFFILVSIVPTLQSIFFYFRRRPYSNIIIQGQLTTEYQEKISHAEQELMA